MRKIFLLFLISVVTNTAFSKTEPTRLRCEYHKNPIGIDAIQPRLSWQIISDKNDIMQSAYEIRAAYTIPGLNRKSKQVWNSGKVESDRSVHVVYEGPSLESFQRIYWQVRVWDNYGNVTRWSDPAYWETGILTPGLWEAEWITVKHASKNDSTPPAHYYRNEFEVHQEVKSARIYVTSFGLYQVFMNGEKVGDQLFTPGWTSYNKRLQYQTYDVTEMIRSENAIGAMLGDGWYRGNIGWKDQRNYYGDQLAFLFQLHIKYTDGSEDIIVSDHSWKTSNGPIIYSDIYNGEKYDARLELGEWCLPGYNETSWEDASIIDKSKDILIASQGNPVRAVEEINPVELILTPKGEMVVDMGQNMVGWIRINLKGKKGEKVVMKFAEVLDKEGNFYTKNLRAAECIDTYIFGNEEKVVFEPHFTFHGFRYIKLEGLSAKPDLKDITGVVIYSDMQLTGSFECSEPLINQLQHNIQWGQKGNFLDVPTDCPQRDERMGWTGDAQVFAPTAAFNFNVAPFYTKWTKDIAADQLQNGVVPNVIPDVLKGAGGSTAWADASIIVPWSTYLAYGDQRILSEQYESMKMWVEYMREQAGDDYLWIGGKHYGDWLAFATTRSDYPGATTDKDLIASAYYSYSSELLAKIAGVVGKAQDAAEYSRLSENIKKAWVNEFVTPSGRVASNTQTAYCLALTFNLLPDDLVEKAAEYLAADVRKMGHLTTGFVGTPLLCSTLSEHGYEDLAFMLLNRKKYPSWLYPITQGATTIWERWDGQKPDGSFQNKGMNSFNHYAYGAIGEWLYTYVSGIQIDTRNPGYKHFFLHPNPGGGLSYAKAEFESMYGKIVSDWKIENGNFIYNIQIPPNTTATVVLPGSDESKKLGSGKYTFSTPVDI